MTQRREFLRQASLIAAGSVAAGSVAAGSVAAGSVAADVREAQAAPEAAPQAQTRYDMTWASRVTGKYRMAFDAPEVNDGTSLHQARSFLAGYAQVYGLTDADLSAVLIIRHAAVPMVLGDALWADGAFGEKEKLKDPVTGEPTKRNPFLNIPADAQHALSWPDGALDNLMARGVIVLACDLALANVAGQIAARMKIPRTDARQLITDHILPGVVRMPTGIFATSHAQGVGCGMMYAG